MEHLIIWAGPVSTAHLKGAVLPVPARVVTVNRGIGGIGSGHFAALGHSIGGSVAELLGRKRIDPDKAETISLVGFSAAWGLFEVLLRDPVSFGQIDALIGLDSYYTGEGLTPKPGYTAFVRAAAEGKKLCVLTTSGHRGAAYPSSQDAVGALLEAVPLVAEPCPELPTAPEQCLGAGGLRWLRYGMRLAHGEHATKLGPPLVSKVLTPFLRARAGWDDTGPRSVTFALSAAGLLLAAGGI